MLRDRESGGAHLVSVLSHGPPGGEGGHHREVALEYSAQQPGQSPGRPGLVLAGGQEGPGRVRDEQSGRVAGQEVGEKFQPGERRAEDHSPRQHVVSAGTQYSKGQQGRVTTTYFGSEPRCLSLC